MLPTFRRILTQISIFFFLSAHAVVLWSMQMTCPNRNFLGWREKKINCIVDIKYFKLLKTKSSRAILILLYLQALDVWMSTCLVFVFSALLEYSFVNVLARNQQGKKIHVVTMQKRSPDKMSQEQRSTIEGDNPSAIKVMWHNDINK